MKILRYPCIPQQLLTNSIFPIFLIVRSGISVSFRYFGFVSVNLGTAKKSVGKPGVGILCKATCDWLIIKTN